MVKDTTTYAVGVVPVIMSAHLPKQAGLAIDHGGGVYSAIEKRFLGTQRNFRGTTDGGLKIEKATPVRGGLDGHSAGTV